MIEEEEYPVELDKIVASPSLSSTEEKPEEDEEEEEESEEEEKDPVVLFVILVILLSVDLPLVSSILRPSSILVSLVDLSWRAHGEIDNNGLCEVGGNG